MCTLSMVIDHQYDTWKDRYYPSIPQTEPLKITTIPYPGVPMPTKQEIDEFYKLLERARKYDEEHGEPDCEMAEKKAKLQELADELGVEIKFNE